MLKKTMRLMLLPTVASVLIACGGGSVGINLSGTAATGAPIANAKVYVVDSLGRTPTGQDESSSVALATTDENGQYVLTSTMLNGLTGPFMVRVVGQMLTESGDMGPAVLHAVTQGSGSSTVNVTPLTEAHAALTLGAQPSLAYGTSTALQNVTAAAVASNRLIT